ncbi:hypothetical protein EV193_105436 [Herbihabitans rhizosphaerae]|uniref:Uncharacterized protein n=2 Tax=Herbihabitans rhizosphaerae TaxID=1872711 RepID=A0A4Q7KNH6_9PSEU|nr:hypothetical protein EV193_105436 [Herbihabitans rhizosphaerae]
MCAHLAGREEAPFYAHLTGNGLEFDLRCPDCDTATTPPELLTVCEGCVSRVTADGTLDELLGWRGEPGVAERLEPADLTVRDEPVRDDVLDLAPCGSDWLLLRENPVRLSTVDGSREIEVPVAFDEPPGFRGQHAPRGALHASRSGRFAAVVTDHGQRGVVVNLHTAKVTLSMDRGTAHVEQTSFPLAFLEIGGREVVAHGTDWNRVDLSDPETGEPLTPREHERHHLDYFYGALRASPDGRWLASDGWAWSPAGLPCSWNAERWLTENVWESEDGPTRRWLCQRWYHWNTGMCWLGDHTLAITGIGPDDEIMIDGVRIFDVSTGAEVRRFAGPRGRLLSDGHRLYSVDESGSTAWDPLTGEKTLVLDGFHPSRWHPETGELAGVTPCRAGSPRSFRRWRPPRSSSC